MRGLSLHIITKYYHLLSRYARFFIKNQAAAEDIAIEVLEQLGEQPSLWKDSQQLRTHLKMSTHIACYQWLLNQALQICKVKSNPCHPERSDRQQPPKRNHQQ